MQQWRLEAQCSGTSSQLFFPDSNLPIDVRFHRARQALEICKACNVQENCLDYAVNNPTLITEGVWGGKTFKQIKRIRRYREENNVT
jgi:hypothetical protein